MADVSIGSLRFENVPVLVAPNGWYGAPGEANDSVMGYDLLLRFLVRIDYRGQRMVLQCKSDRVVIYGVDAGLVRETGAFLAPNPNGFVVAHVLAGASAKRLGLRAGEVVTQDSRHRVREHVLRKMRDRESLLVVRDEDGILADVLLGPKPTAAP